MASQNVYELLKIGLTDGEAKVYLALSELGPSTVGPVVKKAFVAYSNVYDILNRLIKKGIVSFIIKDKRKYFHAASPRNLLEYLDKRQEEITQQKDALKIMLPQLESLQKMVPQQKAELFIGRKGLKTAYETMLTNEKKEENLFFYIHDRRYARESDFFYLSMMGIFRTLPQRGITNELAKASPFFQKYQKLKNVQVRYARFPIPGNIEVCGKKLLIVSWEKTITAVVIHSEEIVNNFRAYFESVWKIARK